MAEKLSPFAADLKKRLGKRPQSPAQLAAKIGRDTARGIGPALAALVKHGHAVKDADGNYVKA